MERQDYSHHVRRHRLLTVRVLYAGLGTGCVVLGILGMFLPVLPTTPFLLLAAGCYARASGRFYNWLLNHPLFGPTIQEWRRHRSIAYRTKVTAIVLMALTLGSSIVFFVGEPWLRGALAAFGVILGIYLYRIPSRDRPQARPAAD